MAKRKSSLGTGQKVASSLVLATLALILAWMLTQQARFNPAVLVALRAPAIKGQQAQPQGAPSAVEAAGQPPQAAPGAPQVRSGLAALLPAEAGGLAALGPAESFDPQTLSDKIDGKAELYLASGFKAMAARSYGAGQGKAKTRVELYLYEMKSPDAAFAVFSGQRRSGAGQSGLSDRAYATENAVFFASGPYYVELVGDRAGPEARKGLDALGQALAETIASALPTRKAAATAKDSDLFPAQGLDAGSLRLSVADVFGVSALNNIYTAGYKLGQAEATGFLSRRKSVAEAQAMAQAYLRFLAENGYRELAASLPAGAKLLELDGSFEVVATQGALFYGVHDASSQAAALQLASLLVERLKEKGQ